jgi:hypothetical protein
MEDRSKERTGTMSQIYSFDPARLVLISQLAQCAARECGCRG